jgi:hypothetical protein
MNEPRRSQRGFWFVVAAGSGLMLLTGAGAYWIKSNADRPQLTLQIAEESLLLPAIHGLAGDKAVAELLVSLPPDLALEVCASLGAAPPRAAKRSCDDLREIAAIAPAASPPAVAASDRLTAPAAPRPPAEAAPAQSPAIPLPAEAAPAQNGVIPPQPSPIETAVAEPEPEPTAEATVVPTGAVPEPPAVDLADRVAVAGVQITSAQTTEPGLVAADDGDRDQTLSSDAAEQTVAANAHDEAYWLLMSEVPPPDSTDSASLDENATADDDVMTSGDAAAARAQAQAKAKAQAQAQAKARAEARAKAGARAAAALNAGNDQDAANGANAGSGKDKDKGSSGAGGGNTGDGGGKP